MYFHPQHAMQTVRQRQADLHALRARSGNTRPAGPIRHRAGWALVRIGQRLAYAAGED